MQLNSNNANSALRIAVIIPVYNREQYLLEALDSIDRQTRIPDEIIVVDDGSTDRSPDIARSWKPKRAPQPRFLTQANQGAAAARNRAIRSTNAELIAPLDSDDVLLPKHLELLESAFQQFPAIVACAGNSGRLDQLDHFKKSGFDESVFEAVHCEVFGALRIVQGSPYHMMLRGAFIPTCSSMYYRQAAIRCGLFDESLRTCEDTDFWLRMSKQGKFGFYMEKISLVRKHDENLTHRRHIVSHIAAQIYSYEKLIGMADTLDLTVDELAATKKKLSHHVSRAVNRASRYGMRSYLGICRELAQRGYWRGLIRAKPLLRAIIYPHGNSPKLRPLEKTPAAT